MFKLLLTLAFTTFALGCQTKIVLPKTMPNEVSIVLRKTLKPENEKPVSFVIEANEISIYEGSGWHNRSRTKYRTNRGEVEKLYQIFIENKFDQIEPKSDEGEKLNEIGEIMIIWDKKNVTVYPNLLSYSTENLQRIKIIESEIGDFVERHKTQEIKE